MPAFTSLQQLNLQQNPSIFSTTTTTGYNPDDFQNNNNNNENIQSWICGVCTFQNHPLLNKCEQCEQPRNPSGTIQITAANFEPRFENVQYQQQAHTNHDTANARSFSMTNNLSFPINKNNQNNDKMVPQSAPVLPYHELPPNFNPNINRNRTVVSSLEELQYENVTQEDHTYVNVSSASVGNIPRIFAKQTQTRTQTDIGSKVFIKGHRYTPSM